MSYSAVVATISGHEGWEFAFEGGARILFWHTAVDRRFVLTLPPVPSQLYVFVLMRVK